MNLYLNCKNQTIKIHLMIFVVENGVSSLEMNLARYWVGG